MSLPTTEQAVAASVACARSLGLDVTRPEVVAEGYSVRVRLHPHPVVTRVVTTGQALRGDPGPWLRREVEVVRFLSSAGAEVVPAWDDAGPHRVGDLEVTLWAWVDQLPGGVTGGVAGRVFGRMLGDLHGALAAYDADLPLLVGPLTDVATGLERSEDPVLHHAATALLPRVARWPTRPLHGDAHTGNLLLTPSGARWTDFEDVCVGPVEWDLASLTLTDETVDAYPFDVDCERLEECRDLRRLQILASLLVGDFDEPALYASLTATLRRGL